jgi:hypothetical protein
MGRWNFRTFARVTDHHSSCALKRHLLSASTYRKQLAAKFIAWREFTEVTRNPSTGF